MGDCEPVASNEGEGKGGRRELAGTGGDSDAAALDVKDQVNTPLSEELAMGACEATRAGPVIDVGSEDSGKDKYVISELAMDSPGGPGGTDGAEVVELTKAGPVTVLPMMPDTDEISQKLASDAMATRKTVTLKMSTLRKVAGNKKGCGP